jgi:hypothetical protein
MMSKDQSTTSTRPPFKTFLKISMGGTLNFFLGAFACFEQIDTARAKLYGIAWYSLAIILPSVRGVFSDFVCFLS